MWWSKRARGARAFLAVATGAWITLLVSLPIAGAQASRAQVPAATPLPATIRVTPVTGPSWLNHLHISFDVTSMGRMGENTPPPTVKYEVKVRMSATRWPCAGSKATLPAWSG